MKLSLLARFPPAVYRHTVLIWPFTPTGGAYAYRAERISGRCRSAGHPAPPSKQPPGQGAPYVSEGNVKIHNRQDGNNQKLWRVTMEYSKEDLMEAKKQGAGDEIHRYRPVYNMTAAKADQYIPIKLPPMLPWPWASSMRSSQTAGRTLTSCATTPRLRCSSKRMAASSR